MSLETRDRARARHRWIIWLRPPPDVFVVPSFRVAQILLLPNWVAGPAGLIGIGVLFFYRVGREESLMTETFGDQYRAYMRRTARIVPWLY